jgi:hydroxymethylpyrimidine/phosphomethylpyrimidine kinase
VSSPPRILAVAGSDSSGGAGIQADIKTITMLGGYAMTAITAVTAQNTVGVQAIAPISGDVVAEQIASCIGDIGIDAIKIGMLHDVEIIAAVADALAESAAPVVLDPVMIATSGATLIAEDAISAMKQRLFPRARVITPNLPELEHLSGRTLRDTDEITAASLELAEEYGCYVLAKGGHTADARVIDLLIGPGEARAVSFDDPRIETRHTHGTGCTLSAAMATLLGHGQSLEHSVRLGRQFVRRAMMAAPGFGAGSGPLGHQAVRN